MKMLNRETPSRTFCFIALVPVVALALTIAQAGTITTVASTIPSNGDLNPYGVAPRLRSTGS